MFGWFGGWLSILNPRVTLVTVAGDLKTDSPGKTIPGMTPAPKPGHRGARQTLQLAQGFGDRRPAKCRAEAGAGLGGKQTDTCLFW